MELRKLKKLGLFLVLILIVPAISYAYGDDPQFKVDTKGGTGFAVTYAWGGEGKGPITCTVTVRVRYGAVGKNSKNGKNEEEFTLTREIHNTGSGWAEFDGKSDLDNATLLDVSIQNHSCR